MIITREIITKLEVWKNEADRYLDYFFLEPVSPDITQAITSDDLSSSPASISFFDVIHPFLRDFFSTPASFRLFGLSFGPVGRLPLLHPLDLAFEVVVLAT